MVLEEFLKEWNNDEATVLVHTSGSTGKPKPMYVEKERMLNSARITCDFLGLRRGDTALLCMPLDYIAGKMVVVRSLERGLNLVSVMPSGHPLVGVEQYLDFAAMVPLQVFNSLQVPEEKEKLRAIRHLIIGGGAVDEAMAKELYDFPNAIWCSYGMTETLSHIALRRINGAEADEWYRPFPSVDVSLNDDGCLVIDAPLVHDGVLVTNDRCEIEMRKDDVTGDSAKVFRILGRKDNVIDSGGIKIQIEEVEKKLKSHLLSPYIITKRKDNKFGEAVVLLTEDCDVEKVAEQCRTVLPRYWQPQDIIHVAAIPLTETGKPARAIAMEMAEKKE